MQEMLTCANEICWTFGVVAVTQNFIIHFLELEVNPDGTLVDVKVFCGYLATKYE